MMCQVNKAAPRAGDTNEERWRGRGGEWEWDGDEPKLER